MTDKNKIKAIQSLLKETRKRLNEALNKDSEYDTTTGNSVNPCEASQFFREIEAEIGNIINLK